MAKHLGGFDCTDCDANYARKETLHLHFSKTHQKKLDPNVDYGHFTRSQREVFIKEAREKKQSRMDKKGIVPSNIPINTPSPKSTLTGDEIMAKCLESSGLNTPSTTKLLDFLDKPKQVECNVSLDAPSTLGGDSPSLMGEKTLIDAKIPLIPNPVSDLQGFVDAQWNVTQSDELTQIEPLEVPMDTSTLSDNTIDTN